MFSRKDYDGYFKQLVHFEVEMIANINRLLAQVTDKPVRTALEAILDDEIEHAALVAEMRRLFLDRAGS